MENSTFDLIISDIEMPEMDGLTFIKNVRNIEKTKNIPAIALTSLNSEKDRKEGLEAGFDYYEIKLNEDELINIVKAILAKIRGDLAVKLNILIVDDSVVARSALKKIITSLGHKVVGEAETGAKAYVEYIRLR